MGPIKKPGANSNFTDRGQNGRTEGEAIRDALMVCLNTHSEVF